MKILSFLDRLIKSRFNHKPMSNHHYQEPKPSDLAIAIGCLLFSLFVAYLLIRSLSFPAF